MAALSGKHRGNLGGSSLLKSSWLQTWQKAVSSWKALRGLGNSIGGIGAAIRAAHL